MKRTLYAKDSKGQIRFWSIEETSGGLDIEHGLIDGLRQNKFEPIDFGLASRSTEEQIRSRFNSRINKKIDAGYCDSIEDAIKKPRTNALGFDRPMLAKKFDDIKNIDFDNLYYQHKYDGNRMLIRNNCGEIIAYTRQGKIITAIPEILNSIDIPEGITIDGEIYCHGVPLQTINSWVKKRQPNSKRLLYHAYDIIIDENYEERIKLLNSFKLGQMAHVVPTKKYDGTSVQNLLKESISSGYEGLILRQNNFGYEPNKRSKSLIKVKQFQDGEFKIKNISLSKDDIPILHCITDKNIEFKVTAPGSMQDKCKIYYNRDLLIGAYVRVEYSCLTKENKPFHPVATHIITDRFYFK